MSNLSKHLNKQQYNNIQEDKDKPYIGILDNSTAVIILSFIAYFSKISDTFRSRLFERDEESNIFKSNLLAFIDKAFNYDYGRFPFLLILDILLENEFADLYGNIDNELINISSGSINEPDLVYYHLLFQTKVYIEASSEEESYTTGVS